jgi:1-acyl-sn-glycerol-3-phosphate acyltransferase
MVYPIGKRLTPLIYHLWVRKVTGLGNIPKDRPFIFAANHSSFYDALLLHTISTPIVNKYIHAFVNSSYWNNFVFRTIVEWGRGIPVYVKNEKDSKKKNEAAFREALDYIKKGDIVMIFPEGGRSKDGKLKRAYHGIAKLALTSKVSVIPVGIIDSHKVLPKGKFFPRFRRCEVRIGKPMNFEEYYNKTPANKILEETTRKIMKEIAKLIGQKYKY